MAVRLLTSRAALLLCAALLAGCAGRDAEQKDDGRLRIVCTTGMIADAARNVAGPLADVRPLMGPGVDPHLYKATERDIRLLAHADIVFYNGLHLEGRMGEVLSRLGERKPVVALGESLPAERLRRTPEGALDPHIWFDVSLWQMVVRTVADTLKETDPSNAQVYEENARRYLAELEELHRYSKEQIATIPRPRRVLVTAHDAFRYFGEAYDIEVRGIQGLSTESEASVRDINELARFLASRGVKAVFVESTISPKNVQALIEGCRALGHEVRIGGELFGDAMGAEGTPQGTYTGMVRHNVDTIVRSLR